MLVGLVKSTFLGVIDTLHSFLSARLFRSTDSVGGGVQGVGLVRLENIEVQPYLLINP